MRAELISPETIRAEREELAWLLTSGNLGRSANIVRVLRFVCEEHFAGRGDELKEYTIAVEALGRRADFDSQSDTIVRVTVHSLRKRLAEIYENEGAERPFRIVIPSGRYVPSFLPNHFSRRPWILSETVPEEGDPLPLSQDQDFQGLAEGHVAAEVPPPQGKQQPIRSKRWRFTLWAAIAVTLLWSLVFLGRSRMLPAPSFFQAKSTGKMGVPPPRSIIHALMGSDARDYVDSSGNLWATGHFCSGGADVKTPNSRIRGTEDPALYQTGVRGMAHCIFPVPPGLYEIHFFFAETTDLAPATRVAQFSINAGPNVVFDVVDEAGESNLAISTVVTGVEPENDGAIHIDYVSEVSLLYAVEILQAPSKQQLPVRIVAGPKSMMDAIGQQWTSDRYFVGGRHGQENSQSAKKDIYSYNRVGRFRYVIPVTPLAKYRVRLYFKDPWFGPAAGDKDVKGSRIFNVECNGTRLLERFDIAAESGGAPVMKTFDHVQASEVGRLELSFEPIVNYPIVNAIEVTAEP
jgi:hypothetical protein